MRLNARHAPLWPFLIAAATVFADRARAAAPVELEIATQKGFAIGGAHKWIRHLSDAGFSSIRVRQARAGDRAEVKREGAPRSPIYRVTGILSRGDVLLLPGGRFRLGDRRGLTAWIDRVRNSDKHNPERKAAFGLTAEQLVRLHEQLAAAVDFTTRGKPAREVVIGLARATPVPITVDPASRGVFADAKVADELRGVSAGTALAAVVRPLGLVVRPIEQGGKVTLLVVDSRKAQQSWPIGWPPKKSVRELAPKLYAILPVEIADQPLGPTLDVLQGRIEIPFLYDYNGLARQRIDLAKIRVSLPATKTFYKSIVSKLLSQAKLRSEVRVDEAGNPLLWISPIKG